MENQKKEREREDLYPVTVVQGFGVSKIYVIPGSDVSDWPEPKPSKLPRKQKKEFIRQFGRHAYHRMCSIQFLHNV